VHANVVDAVTAAQVAAVSVLPVSSRRDDDPVEVIASEKVTVMATVPPTLNDPEAVEDVTPVTVGPDVSMTIVLLVWRPLVCKVGRVSVAALPATSLIVPVRADVDW
jgi:hypothetical protein